MGIELVWKLHLESSLLSTGRILRKKEKKNKNQMHKYKMANNWLDSSTAKEELGVIVDCKKWTEVSNGMLLEKCKYQSAITGSVVPKSQGTEQNNYLTLIRLKYWVQLEVQYYKKYLNKLKRVCRKATRIRCSENMTFEDMLKELHFNPRKKRLRGEHDSSLSVCERMLQREQRQFFSPCPLQTGQKTIRLICKSK